MIWVDYLLLGIVALSAVVGLFRGLVKEALSLAVWVLAIWCGWRFAPLVMGAFSGVVADPTLQMWAARAAILIGVLLLGALATWLISYLLDRSGLTGTDRLLGGLFGLARGGVFAAILVIMLQFAGFEQSPWWTESKLIPYTAPLAGELREVAAEGVGMLRDSDESG